MCVTANRTAAPPSAGLAEPQALVDVTADGVTGHGGIVADLLPVPTTERGRVARPDGRPQARK